MKSGYDEDAALNLLVQWLLHNLNKIKNKINICLKIKY